MLELLFGLPLTNCFPSGQLNYLNSCVKINKFPLISVYPAADETFFFNEVFIGVVQGVDIRAVKLSMLVYRLLRYSDKLTTANVASLALFSVKFA